MTPNKDNLFKATKLSAQDKAEQTSSVARDILAAETAARDKKTEKLRALRLAQETVDAPKNGRRK